MIIAGGALAGAASAILLLEKFPQLRLLIAEKSPQFTRRVGEATVEISALFLSRVLDLTDHLNHHHLVKQGLRFWFYNEHTRDLDQCSEIGGRYLARVPSYQVDRAVLDQEVLNRAEAAGAKLLRPAKVTSIFLEEGGTQKVVIQMDGAEKTLTCRWVIDASGFAALLSRQEGWYRKNTEHPTAAVWARWKNVKSLDSRELAQKYPEWSSACAGVRSTATNHLMGRGWWSWWIPLKGGDYSIGIVFDERLVQWQSGNGSLGERLKQFLMQHPYARELLENATWVEGDVHYRGNLAFSSTRYMGDGFSLVGDSGAFIDPFYSPGMDWLTYTVSSTVKLISKQLEGMCIRNDIAQHNIDFQNSYTKWFEALYKDKYYYFGEFDLVRLAFLIDLGTYYAGVINQPFKYGMHMLATPVFKTPGSVPFFHFMRFYNRRLCRIAEHRAATGTQARLNHSQRFMFGGYTLEPSGLKPLLTAILGYFALELREGWKTWFTPRFQPVEAPLPQAPIAKAPPVA